MTNERCYYNRGGITGKHCNFYPKCVCGDQDALRGARKQAEEASAGTVPSASAAGGYFTTPECGREPPNNPHTLDNVGWIPWHPVEGWDKVSFESDEDCLGKLAGGWQWIPVFAGPPSSEPGVVTRLPVPGTKMTRLSDIADELIRQLRKHGMERMQAVFDGMRLRIDPWEEPIRTCVLCGGTDKLPIYSNHGESSVPCTLCGGNQASTASSGAELFAPEPRGSLPNSLGSSSQKSSDRCPDCGQKLIDPHSCTS